MKKFLLPILLLSAVFGSNVYAHPDSAVTEAQLQPSCENPRFSNSLQLIASGQYEGSCCIEVGCPDGYVCRMYWSPDDCPYQCVRRQL